VLADIGRGLELVPGHFSSPNAVVVIARRLLAQAGRDLTGQSVYQASLPYGPQVTVILPPVAVRGPIIEVRRVGAGFGPDALTARGIMSADMLEVVRNAIASHRNIVVAGPVGSGVTTVLGAIADMIDETERLVTVEGVPDLRVSRQNVVCLGTGAVNGLGLGSLVQQAGRMRADRLVVDDVKGADALEVLTEVASRKPGNLIGVHVSPGMADPAHIRALMRLRTSAPQDVLDTLIAGSMHLLIELGQAEDGSRRVVRMAEVVDSKGAGVEVQDLFRFDGDFKPTGASASFGA
jgi:pilus assembly protein CpaF